jgi:hypothetical protein
MALVPHERSLVKRMQGKPFALLGIDVDETRENLKKAEVKHQITWRSFFDGPRGPIVARWNVMYFPMIYVLDSKGVIRYKRVTDKALDRAVDLLVGEVESAEK